MSKLEKREHPDMSRAASAAADVAADAVMILLDDFKRPSFRAGFGATLLSTAIFARMGARPSLAIFTSLMIGAAVERLYGMAEDIHGKLTGDAPGEV